LAIRPIIRMGHPRLRQRARELSAEELADPATGDLVADMVDTLADAGGIGLAAPQIDVPLRLAIIHIPAGASRYGDLEALPLTVYANPVVEVMDPTTAGYWEGCLSVPGLRGFVERPQHVRIRYQSLDGMTHAVEYRGFTATVFQHEFDHLDGRLYVDRISDPRLFAFEAEFEQFVLAGAAGATTGAEASPAQRRNSP